MNVSTRIHPVLVLLVALAFASASVGCASGDGDEAEPVNTWTASTSPEQPSVSVEATERPTSGKTRVGLVTELPALPISWERHTLDPPQPKPREALVTSVAIVDDELVAVAVGWSPAVENQVVYTWRSTDGADWDGSTLEIPPGQHMYTVIATGDRLIGLISQTTVAAYVPRVLLWDPLAGWVDTDLTTAGVQLEGVEFVGAAGTGAGIVLGGRRDQYDPVPTSLTFEVDGYRLEIDQAAGTYQVTDFETGRLAAGGQLDEIYHHAEDGQPIYDLDDGTLLTVVPWEIWEEQTADHSPLPIPFPAQADPEGDPGVTVSWDGYEITRLEAEDRFTVTLSGTGELVTSGTLADLYRGPAPIFVDRETGEVLIRVTWDEWYDLLSTAEQERTEPHVEHSAQHIVLFSEDGSSWSEQLLEDAPNTHLESVLGLDDRFVVTVAEHLEFGTHRTSYVSVDGRHWSSLEGGDDNLEYLHAVTAGSEGAIALTDVNGSSGVAVSSDGLSWSTGLFLPRQDDGRYGWLREVASGGLGRAVIGTLDPDPTADVITVTVGSRTARFAGPDSALQITDDSGTVLLDLDWGELERSAQGAGPTYVSYSDGVAELRSADGTLLMTITDEQAREAIEQRTSRIEAGIDHVLFLEIDGRWFEAELPDVGGAVPEQIAVGGDTVAVGVNPYSAVPNGDDIALGSGPFEVLIGHIEG